MTEMVPVLVTLPKWAAAVGVSYQSVKTWKKTYDDFPAPAVIESPRWHKYRKSDLDRFMKRHPTLGQRRGGWNRKAGE